MATLTMLPNKRAVWEEADASGLLWEAYADTTSEEVWHLPAGCIGTRMGTKEWNARFRWKSLVFRIGVLVED